MVENLKDSEAEAGAEPGRHVPRDWRGLFFEREAGTPTHEIAARLGLTENWVSNRLWQEGLSLPPPGPARLAAKLEYFLVRAEADLAENPARVEKTARAVIAMTRASEAVVAFAAQHKPEEAGADNEQEDRAELERRIFRLIDAKQGEGAHRGDDTARAEATPP